MACHLNQSHLRMLSVLAALTFPLVVVVLVVLLKVSGLRVRKEIALEITFCYQSRRIQTMEAGGIGCY